MIPDTSGPAGILLGAGHSHRFGADKLTQALADGEWVAVKACRNLLAAVGRVVAVVQPHSSLIEPMRALGAEVAEFQRYDEGMGASLAFGVAKAQLANGWIVALADMPWVASETISAVANELDRRGGIVAPVYQGRRGHPVAFSREFGHELVKLSGDQGARTVLEAHREQLCLLDCADAGILKDIDTPADLR